MTPAYLQATKSFASGHASTPSDVRMYAVALPSVSQSCQSL